PKADYYDKLVDYNLLTNFRNTAKELGIPQNQFISFLMDKGLIYRDKKKKLLPYADKNKGYFEVKEWVDPLGTLVGIQTFITPKGRHYLLILLDSEGFYDE
ncbi:TPA: phage antirepressor KilAC domain-containing protein, partial [Streptococcus pyogenes]|nr:phage antirepressor KilAC domain-containing protein [Streptococcus pyogenes]